MNVMIETDADRRLWAFIRSVNTEIGGWGYAFLQDDGSLLWTDTFLIPQEVSGSIVDFDATGGDEVAINQALKDGVLAEPNFVWVSWHSHHTMKAFWSSTDDARIKAIGTAGVKRLLSLVGCHDGEYKLRLDFFDVDAHGIKVGQVTMSDLKLEADPEDEFEASIRREVAANVRKAKPPSFNTMGNSYRKGPGDSQKQLPKPIEKKEADYAKHTDGSDLSISEAFDVKALMVEGLRYDEALELVESGVNLDDLLPAYDTGGVQ